VCGGGGGEKWNEEEERRENEGGNESERSEIVIESNALELGNLHFAFRTSGLLGKCKIRVRVEKWQGKKGKKLRSGKAKAGGTDQSGVLTLIRTSCDSSWKVRFFT
jgi:hypothetical protein